MSVLRFQDLWDFHPYPHFPCSKSAFPNQCAIRLGVAFESAGIDTTSFDKLFPQRRCYPGYSHNPRHILAAHELARWIDLQPIFRQKQVFRFANRSAQLAGKRGIIFIENGWGSTDHIDLWDGASLKRGSAEWIEKGDSIWFWELSL